MVCMKSLIFHNVFVVVYEVVVGSNGVWVQPKV